MEPSEQDKQVKQVRTLISDVDPNNQLLTDDQIITYLELNDWDTDYKQGVYRAAAEALESIAVSEVLVAKKIRTQDLTTDGPAVSKELRELAARLRGRADDIDEAAGSFFQILPFGSGHGSEGEEYRWL